MIKKKKKYYNNVFIDTKTYEMLNELVNKFGRTKCGWVGILVSLAYYFITTGKCAELVDFIKKREVGIRYFLSKEHPKIIEDFNYFMEVLERCSSSGND